MSNLKHITTIIKPSKFDLFRYIRNKHLPKSTNQQHSKNSPKHCPKDQLFYSIVNIDPHIDNYVEKFKNRVETRKNSIPEKRVKLFLTSLMSLKDQRPSEFLNTKNMNDSLLTSTSKSARFKSAQSCRKQIKSVQQRRRRQPHPLKLKIKSISQNVVVCIPKRQSLLKKASEVRIKKAKKTLFFEQKTEQTQKGFDLCGWESKEQQEFI